MAFPMAHTARFDTLNRRAAAIRLGYSFLFWTASFFKSSSASYSLSSDEIKELLQGAIKMVFSTANWDSVGFTTAGSSGTDKRARFLYSLSFRLLS